MGNKNKNFDFTTSKADISSIIHCIALHGSDLIGLELGVLKAESFCTILQNCPNVKVLHGVDSWQPYDDCLKFPYDGKPAYSVDQKHIEIFEFIAHQHIKYSGFAEKAIIHKKDTNEALVDFEEESLDFIFIDTYMNYQQAKNDVLSWYSKVKPGGIFSGHDWDNPAIQKVVNDFRKENNIQKTMSTFDSTWIWYK